MVHYTAIGSRRSAPQNGTTDLMESCVRVESPTTSKMGLRLETRFRLGFILVEILRNMPKSVQNTHYNRTSIGRPREGFEERCGVTAQSRELQKGNTCSGFFVSCTCTWSKTAMASACSTPGPFAAMFHLFASTVPPPCLRRSMFIPGRRDSVFQGMSCFGPGSPDRKLADWPVPTYVPREQSYA